MGTDDCDELDGSSLSSDDDSRLFRGRVKTIVLDDITIAFGFRSHQQNIYTKVLAASKRSTLRTMRWIQQVETKPFAELEVSNSRWDDLDVALAEAVVAVAIGRVKTDLLFDQM